MEFKDFMRQMEGEGVWVLAAASLPMQAYVAKHHKENYNKEILKYMTPQKYIKKGSEVTVVSLTRQIWGGIKVYDEEDIIFKEINGVIHSIQNKKRAKTLVSAIDFQVAAGAEVLEGDNLVVETEKYQIQEEKFKEQMLSLGYLTAEEYGYYTNPEHYKELTVIKTANF